MASRVLTPADFEWITRPHQAGEPARHVAELSERVQFAHTRANVWRYEPGMALQTVNRGGEDLLVYAYGTPPEDEHAQLLDSAV
jgi:hypothetical protein